MYRSAAAIWRGCTCNGRYGFHGAPLGASEGKLHVHTKAGRIWVRSLRLQQANRGPDGRRHTRHDCFQDEERTPMAQSSHRLRLRRGGKSLGFPRTHGPGQTVVHKALFLPLAIHPRGPTTTHAGVLVSLGFSACSADRWICSTVPCPEAPPLRPK